MARISRFTVDNGTYHILCRGHNRQNIFHDKDDFRKYLEILLDCKTRYAIKIYHYVIMSNHLHLIIMSPDGSAVSKMMKVLNQKYAQHYYRAKYGGVGYVWQDRFKSFLIQEGKYLLECGRYIELNPVRAGIVSEPQDYPWSSYGVYAFARKDYLVDINPEYLALSENPIVRMEKYVEFVKDGFKERRGLERYFRSGFYGDKDLASILKEKGLRQINWKKGRRPKWQKK